LSRLIAGLFLLHQGKKKGGDEEQGVVLYLPFLSDERNILQYCKWQIFEHAQPYSGIQLPWPIHPYPSGFSAF